jgi:hypothetical protein
MPEPKNGAIFIKQVRFLPAEAGKFLFLGEGAIPSMPVSSMFQDYMPNKM